MGAERVSGVSYLAQLEALAGNPSWELRQGDYREALAHVDEVQAVIADPPYGDRTHKGHDAGGKDGANRRDISYAHWSRGEIRSCVEFWQERCSGWMVFMSCSDLAPIWRQELDRIGRQTFQPLPCVLQGMTVRMSGDGPSSWAVYLNVARPRSREFIGKKQPRGGTRPGAYVGGRGERGHIGGKPLWLMEKIIEDYTLPGDLIADPCAGYATTGLAALKHGRRFVGAEVDPDTFEKGWARLEGATK